jgi:hypothetical protein
MSTGKWTQPGVPHRGWYCVYVEDLGEPDRYCDMCETQPIRYVHYMQHHDYPEELPAVVSAPSTWNRTTSDPGGGNSG